MDQFHAGGWISFRAAEADSSVKRDMTQSPAIIELVAKGMHLLQSKDLHAKVYASEKASLVTSLNLLESSFNNSIEVGVWFTAGSSGHSQVLGFLRTELKDQISDLESQRPAQKRERSKKRAAQETEASCIRCGTCIKLNEDRPLCRECYGKWKVYENPDYDENYCHACGDDADTTVAKPLCEDCFYS
ncbi:MAG: hypothetical protein DI536_34375 [Archangium gephyra]|uniref:Uncharacterized protein n=1 Tax=Archangium gephyra TaxID=48 RepID=A0A2W5V318_9BACT|nr:MAG: hypothetical protein DI536_34375 [Archangium gephyra]